MRKTTASFAAILLLVFTACGSKFESKSSEGNTVSQETSAGQSQAKKIEMPKVKYPAAIVFEGGKGDPWFDEDNSKHTPTWRLYICLEKTTQPVTGQVTLDLAKLGTPIDRTWQNAETKDKLYTERLNKVLLNYTYTTELSEDPAKNYGYAYGKATVDMKSVQSFELVYQAPGENHVHKPYDDIEFFNVKTDLGTLVHFGVTKFEVNGESYYVSNGLDRFTYSENDNRSRVVEACEKANQSYVLQVGKEVTPAQ
jgi:hypothetical protein